MGTLFVDKLDPQSGTSLEIGSSGDTMTVPSGATFNVAGTLQSGGATVANTPSLKAVRGSAQSIPNTTSTVVIFDTEIYDTDSAYDNSTGIFTVPAGKGGKYAFFVTGGYDDNGDINICNFWLSKNNQTAISATGGLAIGIDYFHKGTSAQNIAQQVSGCFSLAAGDTMRVYTWQNYGSARNLNQGGRMTFSGFKLL